MSEQPLTIWTVGHSNRTLGEFLALLSAHEIEAVADVRRHAGSRKHPHFNPDALAGSLAEQGTEYVSFPELGGRRRPRRDSHNTIWRNASFRGYADYMETSGFRAGIERLLELARRKHTAVMCAEAVWWRCHRSMIADDLKANGVCVRHIPSLSRSEIHPYTSAAHFENGRLTYVPGERPGGTPCAEMTAPAESSAAIDTGRRTTMRHKFKVGDHVRWNSEAGHVSGRIIQVHTQDFDYKGYTHHASQDDPQYEIQSDKTEHVAVHKGSALRKAGR